MPILLPNGFIELTTGMNYCLHIETVYCNDEITPHRVESVATERGFTHLVEDMGLAVVAVAHDGKSHKGLMEKYPYIDDNQDIWHCGKLTVCDYENEVDIFTKCKKGE